MYQRKGDVDMLNGIKSVLANKLFTAFSTDIHINLTLIHCTL